MLPSTAPLAHAAEAPPRAQCAQPPSADYVPGVDVSGKPVAPADANGQAAPDLGTVTIVPRLAVPGNRIVRDAQVVVDLKRDSSTSTNCPPTSVPVPKPRP